MVPEAAIWLPSHGLCLFMCIDALEFHEKPFSIPERDRFNENIHPRDEHMHHIQMQDMKRTPNLDPSMNNAQTLSLVDENLH